ncbi:MAG TPA: right-handed parallel beta-helix repeat-containing protein [Anaerolineaceae bacterium]|nr:right-handed parallel beta-helix repeat-containing protein [Anaerolineaceae bacterium]
MNFRAFHRILASVILLLSLFSTAVDAQADPYDFIVDVTTDMSDANPGDNACEDAQGNCSLRAALEESKLLTPAGHTVNIFFDLPSPATIEITSDLPSYTQASLINDDPMKRVTINGNFFRGFIIAGDQDTTVEGLIIKDFDLAGVMVYIGGTDTITNNVFVGNDAGVFLSGLAAGNGSVHVTGNYIGYNPFTELRDQNNKGIEVKDTTDSDGDCQVWIGGLTAEDGNVIAGNSQSGIYIDNEKQNTDIIILNNYIGMVDDTTPEFNNRHGIEVVKSAGILNIGGDYLTQGNLIAGNKMLGVSIAESNTASIQGNIFSSNAAGTAYIPNQMGDVKVFDSPYLRIGGDTSGYGNVIPQGVTVESNTVNNVNLLIKHNFLGISKSGYVYPIDPDRDGIYVEDATGVPDISFNQITNFNKGIVILSDSVVPITKNKIYGNREMGIDLEDDGVTLNDNLDSDTGPNGLQNYPVIFNVVVQDFGAVKIVTFDVSLHSAPNQQYLVEVYSSPFCGSNGYGQGKQILKWSSTIITESNGNSNIWEISDTYPTNIIGPCLSATASRFDGVHYLGTSEFSPGVMAWELGKIFLPMMVK